MGSGEASGLIEYVEKIRLHIRHHYQETIDIEGIALTSGSSTNRFYRMFRQITGFTPHQYLTMVRLRRALQLLARYSGSVAEVAHEVGYQDEFYFSRVFKKQCGISPTQYAAATRMRVAVLSKVILEDLRTLGFSPVFVGDDSDPRCLQGLAANEPDMILAPRISDAFYIELFAIAPVCMLDDGSPAWQQRLLQIGEALQVPTVAGWWLKLFAAKQKNPFQSI